MIDPVACVQSVLIQNEVMLVYLQEIAKEMSKLDHEGRMVLKELPQQLAIVLLKIEDKYAQQ